MQELTTVARRSDDTMGMEQYRCGTCIEKACLWTGLAMEVNSFINIPRYFTPDEVTIVYQIMHHTLKEPPT